ncbi:MAG: Asp-tRNA(Asn)/Glu-tRNA(Gln) amidotransferase subunit GatC [Pseudomonadota bacterium]
MSLTLADIGRIAQLARIEVNETEAQQTLNQLSGIFTLIEQMQAVDARHIEPMAHAQDMPLRLRADEVTESNQREAFQAIAPQVEEGLYLVPKVIE